MANLLTKKVMATIVERCKGYEPLKESLQVKESLQGEMASKASLNRREELLLSQLIHKKHDEAAGQKISETSANRYGNPSKSTREAASPQVKASAILNKSGVVNLDALIREIKK